MLIHVEYTPEGGGQGVGLCELPGLQRRGVRSPPAPTDSHPAARPSTAYPPLFSPPALSPESGPPADTHPRCPGRPGASGATKLSALLRVPPPAATAARPAPAPGILFPSRHRRERLPQSRGPARRTELSRPSWFGTKLEALVATWVHRGISPRVEPVSVFGGLRARNDCYPGVCKGMSMSVA